MSGELMARETRHPHSLYDFVTHKRLMQTEIAMMAELRGLYEQVEQLTKILGVLVGGGADGEVVQPSGDEPSGRIAGDLPREGEDAGGGEPPPATGAGDGEAPHTGG